MVGCHVTSGRLQASGFEAMLGDLSLHHLKEEWEAVIQSRALRDMDILAILIAGPVWRVKGFLQKGFVGGGKVEMVFMTVLPCSNHVDSTAQEGFVENVEP